MSDTGLDTVPLRVAASDLSAASIAAIEASAFGPFVVVSPAGDAEEQTAPGAAADADDALILRADEPAAVTAAIDAAGAAAVLVVAHDPAPDAVLEWLRHGAQDVLSPQELASPMLALRLRAAIERQRRENDARHAYATDLGTGLPHRQQLIEHISQLLALREREPAPMAVLALRVEGFNTTQARFGLEAGELLRRKVGVRLRAGVRASDVVASLGDDGFAVLLGSILAPDDAMRVGAKLMKSLLQPFRIAGSDVAVAAALGVGQYPQDGTRPEVLLGRAVALAAAAPVQGRAGFANFGAPGALPPGAANDD